MQWIEYLTTEIDKCRNMDSVNPLKLGELRKLVSGGNSRQ